MRAILRAKATHLAVTALLVLGLGAGCASETKTVKRETVQQPVASTEGQPGPMAEQQTTEKTTETKQDSGGVISSGVNFIGEVIAFPFRVIGAAFSAIF